MTKTSKILSILTLLYSIVGFAIDTQPAPNSGFVVFDANAFYAVQGSIATYTETTIIGTPQEQEAIMQVVMQQNTGFKTSKSLIADKKHIKTQKTVCNYTKKQATVSKNNSDNLVFNPFGNNPFDQNTFVNLLENVGIGTTNQLKNNSQFTNIIPCSFDFQLLTFDYKKQSFQSHETIIISSNYSKTSRIRPPPYC